MELEYFLQKEKKYRIYWIGATIFLLTIGFFIANSQIKKENISANDYKTIERLFERFNEGEPLSLEALQSAVIILKKHPELHPTYDPLLSFAFAHQNNLTQSLFYANLAMRRAEKLSETPFSLFGEISLLTLKKDFTQALTLSKQLEEILRENSDFSLETLRVFNLLRISLIATELSFLDEAKQAWEEATHLQSFDKIASLFNEGSFTLESFLF